MALKEGDLSEHADRVRSTVARDESASAITASWRRCLNVYRLDPDADDSPRQDAAALALSRAGNADLLAIARPYLDEVFALLGHVDCAVFLTDRDGLAIELCTNRKTDAWQRKPQDWLGTCYSEEKLGTNSVGTCLAEQRGVIIRGQQHFLMRLMNRVGIPLFGPDGRLVGCFNLNQSTEAHDARLDSFLSITVSNFARRIETELFARAYPASRLMLASSDSPRLDALLAVDPDDRVIGATRGARRLLALGEGKLARTPNMNEIFPHSAQGDGDELADIERRTIVRALARFGGNISAAAKATGISRSTLYRKLKSYGLVPPRGVGQPQTSLLGLKSSNVLMRFESPSRTSR